MNKFYIPFQGKKPAAIEVNGHRLLLLSRERDLVEDALDEVGADSVKEVKVGEDEFSEKEFFSKLSSRNHAGVLVMSPELSFSDLQFSLHQNLPWVQ